MSPRRRRPRKKKPNETVNRLFERLARDEREQIRSLEGRLDFLITNGFIRSGAQGHRLTPTARLRLFEERGIAPWGRMSLKEREKRANQLIGVVTDILRYHRKKVTMDEIGKLIKVQKDLIIKYATAIAREANEVDHRSAAYLEMESRADHYFLMGDFFGKVHSGIEKGRYRPEKRPK